MRMNCDSTTNEKNTALPNGIPNGNGDRPLKRRHSYPTFSQKPLYDNGINAMKRRTSSCLLFNQKLIPEGQSGTTSPEQLTKTLVRMNITEQTVPSSVQSQTLYSKQIKIKVSDVVPYIGLTNYGSTCYLNATLQVLFMTEEFRNKVLKGSRYKNVGLVSALQELFEKLTKHKTKSASTRNVIKSLGIKKVYEQQDAVEYFLRILEKIDPGLSKDFTGTMRNWTKCSNNHEYSDISPFKSLQIPVTSRDGPFKLEDGLDLYFKSTTLINDDQMYCDHCAKKCDMESGFNIQDHPTILPLHLKRFAYDYRWGEFVKNVCPVKIPFNLNVQGCDYTLYAVINHMGHFHGGHYNAVIRSFEDNKWYCFNDTWVKETDMGDLEESTDAYLMLYKKNSSSAEVVEDKTRVTEMNAAEGAQLTEASSTQQCEVANNLTMLEGKDGGGQWKPVEPRQGVEAVVSPQQYEEATNLSVLEDVQNNAESLPPLPLEMVTLANKGKMTAERIAVCNRAVARCVVKGLIPLSTVETQVFRDMIKSLNPKYSPPSSNFLAYLLIPNWYETEKKNVIDALKNIKSAAITCDAWTSISEDHYITVTAHYISEGKIKQTVLGSKAVYEVKKGPIVGKEVETILEEFGVRDKIIALTFNNPAYINLAISTLQPQKIGCFAQTLNTAAQKIMERFDKNQQWCAKIRDVIVWLKRYPIAETILQEKQQLLNLPQHTIMLDGKTRWNSFYLMIERFLEQYPAIQAASTEPRLRDSLETSLQDIIEIITDDDLKKAVEFTKLIGLLYTSILCVLSDKNPTCGQVLPVLQKLEEHFKVQKDDRYLVTKIKEDILAHLFTQYKKKKEIRHFLEEASLMDPRFKNTLITDKILERVREAAILAINKVPEQDWGKVLDKQDNTSEEVPYKKVKKSLLVFEKEDDALQSNVIPNVADRVKIELQTYRDMPLIPTNEDPVLWWWEKRDLLPTLFNLSTTYMCVQASSTPAERAFSTVGDAVSQERSHIPPENVDMFIFLQKNS